MPIFDLFRKSPKQEPDKAPQKGPAKDESLVSPEMQKKRYDAAVEFLKAFQERIPLVDGKPHAGTVLSVASRLAGTSLYRSLNYNKDVAPGVIVLSNEVNEAYPQLLNLFAFYGKQNGMNVLAKPLVTKFLEQDEPRMEIAQVRAEYQDQYDEIMKRHGLDYLNAARAGMVVCSILFQYHCSTARDIDPYVATGIVAMGVVEGAKTAPLPSGSGGAVSNTSGKTMKNGNRLVLGERDAAIQEALDNGGAFLDVNPEVLRTLKARNIDPFLIYQKALLLQIEKRVDRIDFVKADVDKLFNEWNGKPQDRAPIHVRLIAWLKKNATAHGYGQIGNSWILKS